MYRNAHEEVVADLTCRPIIPDGRPTVPTEQPSYTEYPPAVLRVPPHAIPALRDALDRTLAELSPHLDRMQIDGYIHEAWLGDPVSEYVRVTYNAMVMDAHDGPFHALLGYQSQLVSARDQLAIAEEHYRRTEGENSDLWGRLV